VNPFHNHRRWIGKASFNTQSFYEQFICHLKKIFFLIFQLVVNPIGIGMSEKRGIKKHSVAKGDNCK